MADKSFVLTVVAVLAVAVLAGSLRNSYSGALSLTQRGQFEEASGGEYLPYGTQERGYIPSAQRTSGLQPLTRVQRCLRLCDMDWKDCKALGGNVNQCTFDQNECHEDCQRLTTF